MEDQEMLSSNNSFHPFDRADFQDEIDYDGGSNPVYMGTAPPGAAKSDEKWQIQKLTYDGSGNIISIRFAAAAGGDQADQTNQYVHVWDDRASLVYTAT